MRVKMIPHVTQLGKATSGIARVVEGYFAHLPKFGVELVGPNDTNFDIEAVHAGMTGAQIDGVCHSHGWYWTADYEAKEWEWQTNIKVTAAARHAKVITVPADWVAETVRRDMHIDPWVINHGIDADQWSHNYTPEPYILWNKNRTGDVCAVDPLRILAESFPSQLFLSTFMPDGGTPNINATGVVSPSTMKEYVQKANVYLATTKETFGIGMLEALASGVPILGFAHGGALDIVEHGVNGYLAPPGDYNALIEGLNYCLAYRDVLGANGRETVKKWTWDAACELVAKAYEEALQPSPPTVSIIIPSYNYSHLVAGAIQSALEQDYPHLLDIIVVDDGSDDGGETERVVGKFMEQDKRVRYIRQPNAGVANARNMGISQTDAKYVCCLDADDSIAPPFLSTLIAPMEEDQSLGLTYSALMVVSHDGASVTPAAWPHECDFDAQLTGDNQVPTCCVFRRSAWKRLGGYRQRYAPHGCGTEDAEFWLRIGAAGFGIKQATTENLFFYRMGGNTTSGKMAGAEWLSWHPWTYNGAHPFASIATPVYHSHPVRQYDEPMVSVVIPVGPGHEHHVIDALDSLEAQTFRQWEAIVVWDTPEPTTALEPYPYVKLVTTAGSTGAGFARNRGAEKAKAPFLLFLDADDYLLPNALSRMLVAYGETDVDSIIYSDSRGEVVCDALMAESFNEKGELLSYDPKTQLAVIANRPEPYSYDKAVRQPDPKSPYFWCYVSSFTPKVWHDEIGGFDESLPAWEDWDYWLRMARAGKPFTLVQEPLLVYRYYSGSRREIGRGIKRDLMNHMIGKFKEVEVMPCSSCRKSRTATSRTKMTPINNANEAAIRASDDDMVRIQYTHPNRGQHRVFGPRTKIFYGQRGGGAEFYVHRIDMEAMPQWFREVRDAPRQVVIAPEVTAKVNPPAPKPLVEPTVAPKPIITQETTSSGSYEDFLSQMREEIKSESDTSPPVDPTAPPPLPRPSTIDTLPGISPAVAAQLKADSITTPEQLVELGIEGLQKYKGVGPARAQMIIETVNDYLG